MGKKELKYEHMALQNDINTKNIIFIGSSRTLFHTSTSIFQNKDLNIYNYGCSGCEMIDFPYMVNKAIEFKPKKILISISVNKLFNSESLGDYININFEDLPLIIKTQNINIIFESIKYSIRNQIKIFVFSSSIYSRLSQYYSKYNFILSGKNNGLKNNESEINSDCNYFDVNVLANENMIVKCKNGDSIMYGFIKENTHMNKKKEYLVKLNQPYIDFLNSLLTKIKKNNIKPIVILEPIYRNNYIYSIEKIKNNLNTNNIIDLTDLKLLKSNWADSVHFNNIGRKDYSNHLSDILLKYKIN